MAISKNGLGHRPFGAWAVEEDKLEEEAAERSRKIRGEHKADAKKKAKAISAWNKAKSK